MYTLGQIATSPNMLEVANLDHEISVALYITKDQVAGHRHYDKKGTKLGVELPDINDVLNGCQIYRTKMIILVHNHPYLNGDCDATPSTLDLEATECYKRMLNDKGVTLLDHIIVCPKGYFSFKQNGLL